MADFVPFGSKPACFCQLKCLSQEGKDPLLGSGFPSSFIIYMGAVFYHGW